MQLAIRTATSLAAGMILLAALPCVAAEASTVPPVTIAVMRFENRGTAVELNPLEGLLARMLITDLSAVKGVKIVERGRAGALSEEIRLSERGLIEDNSAQTAGKAIPADYLLLGSFQGTASELVFNVRLHQVRSGKTIPLPEITGRPRDVFRIESEILSQTCKTLGIDAAAGKGPAAGALGRKPTLAVMYFQNLSLTGRLDSLRKGFTDLLIAGLSNFEDITVVERQELQKAMEELNLEISGLTDRRHALKVGRMLGARVVVLGWFVECGGSLRQDL